MTALIVTLLLEIAASGRMISIAESPSQRIAPLPALAPGQPPLLSFRYFEGKDRRQISGEIFEIQGKYREAAMEYRKAVEKNPRALDLHFRLGRAILMESQGANALENARREFEAELALNASDAAAEYEIGQILTAQGKARCRYRPSGTRAGIAPRLHRGAACRGQGTLARQALRPGDLTAESRD